MTNTKRHLVHITFDPPGYYVDPKLGHHTYYVFNGFVTTKVISPSKLFKTAFGFDIPPHTRCWLS